MLLYGHGLPEEQGMRFSRDVLCVVEKIGVIHTILAVHVWYLPREAFLSKYRGTHSTP